MKEIIVTRDEWIFEEGHVYYLDKSDFHGGCFHVYAAPSHNAHICNYFSPAEFYSLFRETGNDVPARD